MSVPQNIVMALNNVKDLDLFQFNLNNNGSHFL